MKIALVGYGKMGKAVEEIAMEKGHQIVLRINSKNPDDLNLSNLKKADVAIEFTRPETAVENITTCLKAGLPVISGTTGWLEKSEHVKESVRANNGAFLFASNFSIGVNLFFRLNSYLAKMMSSYPDYEVLVKEIHHTEKKDAPSGTAITLAEQILSNYSFRKEWINEPANDPEKLAIISERIDTAPGTHEVTYRSSIDDIQIKHTAHSRKGFAGGAVLAAEFIIGKKGIFTMSDVLGIG